MINVTIKPVFESINRYEVKETIALLRHERLIEFCKATFFSLLTLVTVGNWKETRALSVVSWKRVWRNQVVYQAIIDDTFAKTHACVSGYLRNKDDLFEGISKKCESIKNKNKLVITSSEDSSKEIPAPINVIQNEQIASPSNEEKQLIQQIPVSVVEKAPVQSIIPDKIAPLFNLGKPFGIISKFLNDKDQFALLKIDKKKYHELRKQAALEASPIMDYINKVLGILEPILPSFEFNTDLTDRQNEVLTNMRKEGDPYFQAFNSIKKELEGSVIKSPIISYSRRKLIIDNRIYQSLLNAFKDNKILQSNKFIVLHMMKFNGELFNSLQHFKNDVEVALVAIQSYPRIYNSLSDTLKTNKNIIRAAVKNDGYMIRLIPMEVLDEEEQAELSLIAVKQNAHFLSWVATTLKDYKNIVLAAVKQDGKLIKEISDALKNDEEVVLTAVENDGMALEFVSPALKSNRDIVLKAVSNNGNAFKHASEDLQKDKTVILTALKNRAALWNLLSEEVRNNQQFVLESIQLNAKIFTFLPEELKINTDIALQAIKGGGLKLERAHDDVKNNKQVVMAAVKLNGNNLQYASGQLQDDEEVVLAAVTNFGYALEDASENMRNNPKIVLAAVKQNGLALQFASDELKNDPNIVMEAIKQNSSALEYANESFRNDELYVCKAIKNDGLLLELISPRLRNNKQIVLDAVSQQGVLFHYASNGLKNDFDVAMAAVKNNGFALKFITQDIANYQTIANTAILQNPKAKEYFIEQFEDIIDNSNTVSATETTLQTIPLKLRTNKQFVLEAVSKKGSLLKYASNILKNDFDVAMAAVKNDGLALEYVTEDLVNYKAVAIAAILQNPNATDYFPEYLADDDILQAHNQSCAAD
ncbi:MAG: DUF4116 domain-containing protein [Parachlamydiaceae bacterium]|nr:DUF4116 domain-containing protein [Parachlamydiaceae bacterium]